jgi:SpoVK/Ycf46/Vps4 family AAA+-type ATPase
MFGNDAASFEKGLKEINERADRWNAVILWDECEVFLQHRGTDPVQNARITAALRSLEAFEGVMFLTTNRPGMLDEAITNRVHTKLYYGPFTTDQKRDVWLKLKPAQMQISNFDEVLTVLVQLDLNGRDIKTLLRNTAKVAASEGLKVVPGQYLLEEAKDLLESATRLLNGEAEAELHKNRKHQQNGKALSVMAASPAQA